MRDKELMNKIRNILMNEMGLSREAIRTEMEKIIYDVVSAHMKKMLASFELKKLVRRIIVEMFNESGYGNNRLKRIIEEVAKEEASKLFNELIEVKKIT